MIEIDEGHRIYIFSRRVLYKERVNGKLVTKFSGVSIRDMLGSPVIDEPVKKKISEKLKDLI